MAALELKEILWEITNKCSKNCEYCGSKNIINKENERESEIIDIILDRIIEFKKKYKDNDLSVVLTGGEPAELGEEKLLKILIKLREIDIKTKILTNGKLFDYELFKNVGNYIDVVGYSVNTTKDLEDFEINRIVEPTNLDQGNITIITNFGKHNAFDFDNIFAFIKEYEFKIWQIQLTMGDKQLNESGIDFLMGKIKEVKNQVKIVLADNMNCGKCAAGINSIGITYTGEIVGCLAERSFCDELHSYGNLEKHSLIHIWENGFQDIRFSDCRKCCKDFIDYDFSTNIVDSYEISIAPLIKKTEPLIMQLYGVCDSNQVYVYGVFHDKQ